MTSKEALSDLVAMATLTLNKDACKRLAIIKKDLEVLEILKTEIFNEHCFDLDAGWYDDSFDLNEKEAKIIKEWLEDDW